MEAIFFPKGQNTCYLVHGSIYLDDDTIQLRVNQSYDKKVDAQNCLSKLRSYYPETSDIGIQEHIVNRLPD
jgi:hypothetical protein